MIIIERRTMEREIKIKARPRGGDFSAEVRLDGQRLLVVTEYEPGLGSIISRVYKDGEILSERKINYGSELKANETQKIDELIQKQNEMTLRLLRAEKSIGTKTTIEYLNDLKKLLRQDKSAQAVELLREALASHPDDPFLLSYHGALTAMVLKDYDRGIKICKQAIKELKRVVPFGIEFIYPTFYLNLGRACLAAGLKRDAVAYFNKGLSYEADNPDLLAQISALGRRRTPPIPFLKRSNPLNKNVGLLLFSKK